VTDKDPFQLGRFVEAQEGVYAQALKELHAGRKESHWMWFIFPQFRGLGLSAMSVRFAIGSMEEARAYLEHPVLGARLVECCTALVLLAGSDARTVMGSPDDLKLRSSATLFARVAGAGSVFEKVLGKYFGGAEDARTVEMMEGAE
jgi:uncharacterized protein (DUF1810 family)